MNPSDTASSVMATEKYSTPSGCISSRYSIAVQVRPSVNSSFRRVVHGLSRCVYSGRRGMRSPNSTSTTRPSTSDSRRTDIRNNSSNGMPMIRIIRPNDRLAPVTTQVK